jgi:4-hydroxy-tetrahydrodipicolinate synthase
MTGSSALPLGGIIASLPTPFTRDGSLDTAALRGLVGFAADSESAAILVNGLAGEVTELTERERLEAVETCLDAGGGRLPVLVGAWADSVDDAVRFARAAVQAGAAGVMTSIPAGASGDPAAELARIAAATDLPVVVQDAPGYLGVGLGAAALAEVLRLAPNVHALKLEGGSAAVELVRQRLGDEVPLWGGDGGRHLLDCLRSGANGVVPGVEMVDRLVEVWRLERDGESRRADSIFAPLLPLLVFELESLDRYAASAKHVLAKRGLLDSTRTRLVGAQLSPSASRLLDDHLARALPEVLKSHGMSIQRSSS